MQDPGMAGQRQSLAMLHHHAACRPEETAGAEMGEHVLSDVSPVRRIDEHDLEREVSLETRQASRKLSFQDGSRSRQTAGLEVASYRQAVPGILFSENRFGGAATEGLDPDGSGSRIEIQEAGSFDLGGEDVEEGLPDPAGGRTKKRAAGKDEREAPLFSADDLEGTHESCTGLGRDGLAAEA
jgi:hypothetical protein